MIVAVQDRLLVDESHQTEHYNNNRRKGLKPEKEEGGEDVKGDEDDVIMVSMK